jgi:DNA-binding winged helix-turn-helix (wHTH) protein
MSSETGPSAYCFADTTFRSESGELVGPVARLRLARQPALVLRALLERPGELVTRAELIRAVWRDGVHVDYDQSLNFCIREIRRALGDGAREPRFVETLPKRGYRFLVAVTREGERDESPVEPERRRSAGPPEMEGSRQERRRPARTWVLAAAMGGLLAGAALGHDVTLSPAHDRAVTWFHGILGWAGTSCLWDHER